MNPFVKTCVAQAALLVALALPVFAVGCERQSEPPINPQSRGGTPTADTQGPGAAARGEPDRASAVHRPTVQAGHKAASTRA